VYQRGGGRHTASLTPSPIHPQLFQPTAESARAVLMKNKIDVKFFALAGKGVTLAATKRID
jgi:hypothetical protein